MYKRQILSLTPKGHGPHGCDCMLIVLVHSLLVLSFMISVAKVTIKTFNLSLFATFLR